MRRSSAQHWRLLADLLRPHRRTVGALAVVLAASSILPLVGPQLLRAFIDSAVAGERVSALLLIAAAYAALGLASQIAVVGTTYVATRVAWTVTNDLREQACAHTLGLDLGYHAATSPGALIERIDGDATAIAQFFTDFVVKVAGAGITLVGAVILVTREDLRVGLATAVFVAGAIALTVRLRDRAVPAASAERAAFASVIGLVEEQLDGAEDLRALGAGPDAVARHERAARHHLGAALGSERASAWIWVMTIGFFGVGGLAMLGGGWWLQRAGAITIGTVFLLFQYTQVLRRPIELIAEQLQQVQRAAAGAGRMRQLLDEPTAVEESGTERLPRGALPVRFEQVAFAYTDRDVDHDTGETSVTHHGRVLHSVDLEVPAGSVVGLVGQSGSGKTTLARLALRLADPVAGAVRVGGVDLRATDPEDLRRRVAIVTQDVQLFRASIRDNLTLFDPDPPGDDELADILDRLGLGGWLAGLPAGFDTVLGDSTKLSAGQSQLLGLGRAFLRDPGLVVLDEASSRVDPTTAAMVERALDVLLAGRTAIVIAHRLSAVDRADTVVVLEAGRIVEQGPRTALLADPDSRFAARYRAEEAAMTADGHLDRRGQEVHQ
jgi:ABC-type multidrug transport system fused ATPase/permease subunit